MQTNTHQPQGALKSEDAFTQSMITININIRGVILHWSYTGYDHHLTDLV